MTEAPRPSIRASGLRLSALVAVVVPALLLAAGVRSSDEPETQPVPVRWAEGVTHGFLTLKGANGALLAQGDLLQTPKDGRIESRMVFRFRDGSRFDERVVFSQREVFTVHSYRLEQHGPSFAENAEASFDRASGRYRIRTFTPGDDDEPDLEEGTIEIPADVYNGMAIVLAKNLIPRRSATVRHVAFTPTPRIIKFAFEPVATEQSSFGHETKSTTRFALRPKLGFFLRIGARLMGKKPDTGHAWIVTEDVPAFVKYVGPLSLSGQGAAWTIELASPRWER